jgi:hypothetical protein
LCGIGKKSSCGLLPFLEKAVIVICLSILERMGVVKVWILRE